MRSDQQISLIPSYFAHLHQKQTLPVLESGYVLISSLLDVHSSDWWISFSLLCQANRNQLRFFVSNSPDDWILRRWTFQERRGVKIINLSSEWPLADSVTLKIPCVSLIQFNNIVNNGNNLTLFVQASMFCILTDIFCRFELGFQCETILPVFQWTIDSIARFSPQEKLLVGLEASSMNKKPLLLGQLLHSNCLFCCLLPSSVCPQHESVIKSLWVDRDQFVATSCFNFYSSVLRGAVSESRHVHCACHNFTCNRFQPGNDAEKAIGLLYHKLPLLQMGVCVINGWMLTLILSVHKSCRLLIELLSLIIQTGLGTVVLQRRLMFELLKNAVLATQGSLLVSHFLLLLGYFTNWHLLLRNFAERTPSCQRCMCFICHTASEQTQADRGWNEWGF